MRALLILLAAISGCDLAPDCADETGAEACPVGDSNDPVSVDILLVIDGSSSMSDEATSLLRNTDTLFPDNIDYRLAITTTSMTSTDGWDWEPEGGETGLFVGDDPVVSRDDPDAAHRFQQNLGCWSSCWSGAEMESNTSYIGTAGDCPFPDSNGDGTVDTDDEVTTQYLDCLCVDVSYPEGDDWDAGELCRSGNELHLESTLMAMCRASDSPPEICAHSRSPFVPEWAGTNGDWLRPDTPIVVVYVTDEGDQSEVAVDGLMTSGEDDPRPYLEAFEEFDRTMVFAAIGPDLQCESETDCSLECNGGGASSRGVLRLINMTEATGGFYNAITTESCGVADFGKHLSDLTDLINNL